MSTASSETAPHAPVVDPEVWGPPKYHPTLAGALVAAWGELDDIPAAQTAKGKAFDYTYADLADVHAVTRPVLARHGLAVVQRVVVDGRVVVTTEVVHTSGEAAEFGTICLPAGGDAQAVGSAITYARRYSLCAALGVAPKGDDDDGKAATPSKRGIGHVIAEPLPPPRRDPLPAPTGAELDEVKALLAKWRERLEPLEDHPVAISAKAEFIRAGLVGGVPVTRAKGKAVLAALARLEPKVEAAEQEMLVDEPPPSDEGGVE